MAFSRDPSRPRRRWRHRLLIAFNILLATIIIAGVGSYGYTRWRFDQIRKLDFGSVLRGDDGPKAPMNVLLVGSDSRAALAPGQAKSYGSAAEVTGQRSDTIMILHIDPKAQRAAILSLPRDLWVTIAEINTKQRINTAFDAGPARLIKTINNDFGIPIDHYVEVDFDGFKGMVDAVGGVQVRFDAPARDKMSGLNVPNAGCVALSGDQALAYVRSRHYESYERGRWVTDPRSDFSRIDRQQDFIRRMLRKAIRNGARNPVTLNSLISNGVKNVTIDKGFSLNDITRLGRRFQSLDPSQVEMMTLPTKAANVGGADVLLPKEPDAKQTIDRFLNGPPKPVDKGKASAIPPSSISIRVLNGSSVSGQANDAGGELKDIGFVVTSTGNYRSGASKTVIRYGNGQKDKAEVLAAYVNGDVDIVQDSTIRGVDLLLITGSNFSGISKPDAPKASTTTAPSSKSTSTTAAAEQEC